MKVAGANYFLILETDVRDCYGAHLGAPPPEERGVEGVERFSNGDFEIPLGNSFCYKGASP